VGTEIERKFLVDHAKWEALPKPEGILYRQGYLTDEPERTIRIRTAGEKGFITVKGPTMRMTRSEFEYEIPAGDAEEMLELFKPPRVEKTRYRILFNQKTWEVDVFSGKNEGLIIAEIELEREDESFELPSWVRTEVTEDPRYYNSRLAASPFTVW
jgi:adenylate cyclase